jgi:hypothetical protein
MAHGEIIGREREGISKVVAGLPSATPFVVPEGYFAHFPERLLEKIQEPVLFEGLKNRTTLQAPPGYFDTFPEYVLGLARLDALKSLPTYRVPKGYFEGFPEKVLEKVQETESVDEELQRLSPLLASLPKAYPGKVPAGYFDTNIPVLEFRTQAGEAPVIALQGQRKRSVHPFLAAAVTLGVVLLSAIWGYKVSLEPAPFRSGINLKTPAQFNTALAKISDQAIVEYLKNNTDVSDADLLASEVDDQQLPNAEVPEGAKAAQAQAQTTQE